jgi:hypothetical protein
MGVKANLETVIRRAYLRFTIEMQVSVKKKTAKQKVLQKITLLFSIKRHWVSK